MKKIETEKILCYNIFGIELIVNPSIDKLIQAKGIDKSYKVLHGEFLYRDSLEDCQVIVSEQFLNKFIKDYELIINVVKNKTVWTKNSKAIQKKLLSLEFDVELLFLTNLNGEFTSTDLDDEEDIEYIFRLIEK